MSGWNPADWEVPMFVKVVTIAFAICTSVVAVVSGIVFALMWVNNMWGENVVAAICFGSMGFGLVSLFTWMFLEDIY